MKVEMKDRNAHHTILGNSSPKVWALSIDTGASGLTTESMKSRES